MKKSAIILIFVLIMAAGCIPIKTVYIPHGQAVQLREPLKAVKVWVITDKGEKLPSTMDIPEGFWVLSYDEDQTDELP